MTFWTYSANKSIMDEATDIPVDGTLLSNDDVLSVLKSLYPIDAKKGIKMRATKGDGEDMDIDESTGESEDEKDITSVKSTKNTSADDGKELQKKLSTFYSLILFFAFLSDSKVVSLDDVIKVIDGKDNARIAKNVGLTKTVLQTMRSAINPFVLSDLDYKISHMNQLAHDNSIVASERVDRAMKKFGRLSTSEVVTPAWVADMMVGYLPADKIKKGTKILDIAAKQGEFANALYKAYGDKLRNSIYSLPTSPLTYEFTRKVYSLLGLPVAHVIENFNTYDLLNDKKKDILMDSLKQLGTSMIIGNPPYQDNAVGDQKTYNGPLYNIFLDCAYNVAGVVEMIHPARFLTNAGSTPKAWNKKMLEDKHLAIQNYWGKSIFDDTEIKGGVAISLRNIGVKKNPIGLFTPYPELNSMLQSVINRKDFKPMSKIVITRTAYRFTDKMHEDHPEALEQLSNGHPYDVSTNIFERLPQVFFDEKPNDGKDYIRILGREDNARVMKYVRRDYIRPVGNLDSYKIFMASANANGIFGETLTSPLIGEPGVGNTETFISIGKFANRQEAEAARKYVATRFVRALLGVLKSTHHLTPETWKYVPQQDFSEHSDIDWSLSVDEIDALLCKKYKLSAAERDFIHDKVKSMTVE